MKQVTETQWSTQERTVAKAALTLAQQRELESLVKLVRDTASQVSSIDEVWHLHDFLSARRFDIDGKYDDRDEQQDTDHPWYSSHGVSNRSRAHPHWALRAILNPTSGAASLP